MSLRVVVAEDEPMARMRLSRQLREAGCEVVAELPGSDELIAWFQAGHTADALFLDIQMPGLTGLEALAELDDPPPAVFVTAHVHYALQAFEHAAVDYLLKPVHEDRLRRTVERLELQQVPRRKPAELAALAQTPERLPVRAGEGFVFLDLRKVTHFEVEDEQVYAWAGERFRTAWTSLGEAEEAFPGHDLLRIQRHLLLRPAMVTGFKPLLGGRGEVRVQGGATLPVSRASVPRVRAALGLPGLAAGRT